MASDLRTRPYLKHSLKHSTGIKEFRDDRLKLELRMKRIFAFIFKGSPKKEKQALSIVDKLQSITTSRGAALGMGSCRFFLISRDFH